MKNPVMILGGGISGLSTAWKLCRLSHPAIILESSAKTGGLAGTVLEGDYRLDFGPHSFFSEDEEIRQAVLELFQPPLTPQRRTAKFFFQNCYLDYPFTAADLLRQMGWKSSFRTLLSYLRQKGLSLFKRAPQTEDLENWAIHEFGPFLYGFFFKPYTEQFWKLPAGELSPRAIPAHTRLSFAQAFRSILPWRSLKPAGSQIDREKLPVYHPPLGYGEIADRIRGKAEALGAVVHEEAPVTGLEKTAGGWRVHFEKESNTETIESDFVISTIPIPKLISMLKPAPPPAILTAAKQLNYRALFLLGIAVSGEVSLPASYIYYLHRPYYRITDMNRFSTSASPVGENLLTLEITCAVDDALWKASPESIFEQCFPYLEKDGILTRPQIKKLMILKTPHAYPLYEKNYKKNLEAVQDFLTSQPGLFSLGRAGEFRYMDADQCMRRAFDLADRILQNQERYAAR